MVNSRKCLLQIVVVGLCFGVVVKFFLLYSSFPHEDLINVNVS